VASRHAGTDVDQFRSRCMNSNPTSAKQSVLPFPIHTMVVPPSFLRDPSKERSSHTPSSPPHPIASFEIPRYRGSGGSNRQSGDIFRNLVHRMMSDHRERLMESSRLRILLGITFATSSAFPPAQSFPSLFVVRANSRERVHHSSSVDETLSMLGDGEESRVYLEAKVGLTMGCVMEIWPSASTSSRGIRSIWRPTRLGM
jgi:hypothetical protein